MKDNKTKYNKKFKLDMSFDEVMKILAKGKNDNQKKESKSPDKKKS